MTYRNWRMTGVAVGLSVVFATATLAQQNTVDGTVEKVDKGAGKVTLKHGRSRISTWTV